MPDSLDGFCSSWPGADPGGWVERYVSSPLAVFKYVFDEEKQFFHNFEPLR